MSSTESPKERLSGASTGKTAFMSLSSLLPVELQLVSCRTAALRRHASFNPHPGPRLPRWRTAPYDPDKIADAARPSNPMYYEWSKRANAGLKQMFRFTLIGFGLAAIITPSLYVGVYAWTAYKEIAPMHRVIADDVDPEADRFRWALDANPAFGGAWKHQATDPSMPFSARIHAIASAIAMHVALKDDSDATALAKLGFEGLAPLVPLSRGFATVVVNLQKALELCRNVKLPDRGVLELERNLADAFDASSSVEAAKAAVLQYERILTSLMQAEGEDEDFVGCEVARAARRAGEIARRLSQQQLVNPVEQEIFRQKAVELLRTAIETSLAVSLPPSQTRIRDWWWPLRWLSPAPALKQRSSAVETIAAHLEHSASNVAPSVARSVVLSAGFLAALSAPSGDRAGAEALTRSTIDFLRRHLASTCTDLMLATSPSASLHAHWLNINDAALQSNLAELLSLRSSDEALQLATSASLQAASESLALRARFNTLLGSRSRVQKVLSTAGDPLEPLRRAVQETVLAADNAHISSHMLCGALYELQGDYDEALRAYDRAKLAAAGPKADQSMALAEEAFIGGGMQRTGALHELQWERANLCARRAKVKLARAKGEEAPILPPARPRTRLLRERLPVRMQQSEAATGFTDFLQDQWEEAKAFIGT